MPLHRRDEDVTCEACPHERHAGPCVALVFCGGLWVPCGCTVGPAPAKTETDEEDVPIGDWTKP